MTASDRLWNRWVATGDTRALGQLFDHTGPGLAHMAQYLAHDPAAADDALQGTFLAALERPRDLGEGGRVEAWLAGILIHQIKRQRRDRARDRTVSAGGTAVESALASAESTERSPVGQLAGQEFETRVTSLIAELPVTYAEPLRRRLLAGDSAQSIAQDLGLSLGTVHKRLSRGLKRLRRILPAALATPALGQGRAASLESVRARFLEAAGAGQHVPAAVAASAGWSARSVLALITLPGLSILGAWWALDASG